LIFNIVIRNGSSALKKIVPQIFYIKSFSSFDGDFVAIVLRNAWLLAVLSVFLEDIQSVDGLLMMKYQTGRCNDVVLFSRVNAQINREARNEKGFLTAEEKALKEQIEGRFNIGPKLGPALPPTTRTGLAPLGPRFGPDVAMLGPRLPSGEELKTMIDKMKALASPLFGKLFGDRSESPTTSLQRIGGARGLTGAANALSEQKETNDILRQIKDLLGKDMSFKSPTNTTAFA
jgi:hypothetical protein